MTLRDVGSWLGEVVARFFSDLEIVFIEPLWDWPLYIVVLALPVGYFALVLLGAFFALPMIAWQEFWREHFDSEGNPVTRLGRLGEAIWDFVYLVCVFILVWIGSGFLVVLVSGRNLDTASETEVWIALAVQTLVASIFTALVLRGRRLQRLENGERSRSPDD